MGSNQERRLETMGSYRQQYGALLEAIANEADGVALDVYGEEMGAGEGRVDSKSAGRARLIIDPIDGTEEFSRGIPTFGTLLGIERDGEIVAGMVSAPALGSRWWAYLGEGAYRN